MKCDKIKDILLTDYIDKEAKPAIAREIEGHLAGCKECREFYDTLKEKVVVPFKELRPMEAPENMWDAIKMKIENDSAAEEHPGILAIFSSAMPIRRAIFAAASVGFAVILLSGAHVWRLYDRGLSQKYMELQVQYLSGADTDDASDNGGFGTAIEEFLL
jgi:anti-sigma factor RsiW